jgi:choline dehydrogenase
MFYLYIHMSTLHKLKKINKCRIPPGEPEPPLPKPPENISSLLADYIIVGTGTAGSVLARKLTDNGTNSVIALEAGADADHDEPIVDSAESFELHHHYHAEYFYDGESRPQEDVDERTFDYTGGRLLGGSSSINGEQYVRGTNETYARWEEITKDPDWGPENVTKIYTEMENYNGKTNKTNTRGKDGLVDIRQAPTDATTVAEKLVHAITKTTGYNEILDYNNPKTPIGPFTQWQLYQHPDGTRVSGSIAYLDDIIEVDSSKNFALGTNGRKLKILLNSTAINIIWDNKKAIGITYLQNGTMHEVFARKKVIISAGIRTPQFLLQNGVGPKDDLEKLGITSVIDSGFVGTGLINHTIIPATMTTNPNDGTNTDPNALYTGGAFLPLHFGTSRSVQLIGMMFEPGILSIIVSPLNPESRGVISLVGADPLKPVSVDFKYLSETSDVETYKFFLRQLAIIAENFNDPHYKLISPTADVLASDELLEQYIKANLDQTHHWVGTCRMGLVTDSTGHVIGAENLIIADNTICPTINDGNTSSTALLIGNIIANKLLYF